MVPLECERIVNGASIYSLFPEKDQLWMPPVGVFRWHYAQAVVRGYRAGGIEEPWDSPFEIDEMDPWFRDESDGSNYE